MDSIERPRNVTKLMWTYAFPPLASTLFFNIAQLATYDLYFYGYQLNSLETGIAIGLGYLAIAASQFLIGWISDKYYTKWGRRKPWIILLTPITVISFIALLLPNQFLANPSGDTLWGWLLLWNIVFEASIGFTTPYGAWMAELFRVSERPKTSQIQNTFKFIGTGAFAVFTFLILSSFTDYLKENPGVIPPEYIWSPYLWAVIVFSILFFTFFYLAAFILPKEDPPKTPPQLMKNLGNIIRNKNYLFSVLVQGVASVAWTIIGTNMLPFIQSAFNFGTTEYIIAGATLLITVFIFLYVWRKMLARGKKKALQLLFTIAPIVLPVSLVALVPMSSTTGLLYAILFIIGVALNLGGWYLMTGIWFADLAEDDQKRTGEMKAGIYMGFPSIALNIFQALGPIILGAVNQITYQIPGTAIAIGLVLWGPVCSAFLVVAYFLTKRFIKWGFDWEKVPRQEPLEQ